MDPASLFSKLMNLHAVIFVLTFSHLHPYVVGAALVSLFGLAHDKLAKYPRIQALAHVARSLGINWTGVVDGVVRFVTGLPAAAVKSAVVGLALLVGLGTIEGCANSAPAPKTAVQARQEARAAVVTVEAAWMALAHVCVDVAGEANDTNMLQQCATVLDPIRISLMAADDTINAWGDATSNAPLACKLAKAADDLEDACAVIGAPPAVMTAVKDAVAVADALGGCPAVDGGK